VELLSRMHSSQLERRWVSLEALGIKVGRNEPCPCDSSEKFKHCQDKNGGTHYLA
jgi:uncharacterized protein YchJ